MITFHAKDAKGTFRNLCGVRGEHLRSMFPQFRADLERDAFFSLNAFLDTSNGGRIRPAVTRRTDLVRYLCACFVDIDCHKQGLSFDEALAAVIDMERDGLIPPSIIVSSGRGMWLLWLLHDVKDESAPPRAFPEKVELYHRLQRAIGQRFATIGADLAAKDVARLARVPGSVHTVSSVPVKYWLQLDERRCGFTYTLPQLAAYFPVEAVVDRPRAVRDALTESANPNKRRGWEAMHRRRLADFQILYAIRGGFEEGCRNNGALIYAWLLKCNRTRRVEVETVVLAFGAKCRPPLSPADCRHAVRSAYARKGDGKACFARMLDQTISDWLRVTPEESRLMKFPPASQFGGAKPIEKPVVPSNRKNARLARISHEGSSKKPLHLA